MPLFANPLASPLLVPVSLTLAGLFGSSLLALLLVARGRWRALSSGVLFKRWRTWLAIAPIYGLAVLAGPLPIAILAAALGVQGAREYARLTSLERWDRRVLVAAAILVPATWLWAPPTTLFLVLLGLPFAATLPALLQQDTRRGAQRGAALAFGLAYLPVALASLVLLARHPLGGPGLLLGLGLAVALSDVGAFTAGRLLGGRALAARLSPAKTWAGVGGNLAGALLGFWLLRSLLPDGLPLLALAGLVAAGAVWGDLLESLLKRAADRKDSGTWLPGFGGLLDRLDSLLVAVPLVLVLAEVLP